MSDTEKKEDIWTLVGAKRKKHLYRAPIDIEPPKPVHQPIQDDETKITEPCWFYNNGGCKHKDGSEKTAHECKYLHTYSDNVKRPPHLSTKKPCDKYNLEGECKWQENCKYSHRNLTPEEWSKFYPGIPYTLKTNVEKRLQIETRQIELENRLNIEDFKLEGMSKDIQILGHTINQCLRLLKILVDRTDT